LYFWRALLEKLRLVIKKPAIIISNTLSSFRICKEKS